MKKIFKHLALQGLFFSFSLIPVASPMKVVEIGGQQLSPNDYLGSILNSTYQDQIQAALQDAGMNLQQKIMKMQTIGTNASNDAQKNGITIIPDQLQDTYAQALVTLFDESKSGNAESLNAMKSLLNYAQKSSLLRDDQQAYVRTEMLPNLRASGVSADEVNGALQASSYAAKINNLIQLINKAKNQAEVDPAAQDAFGNALVAVFEERTSQQPAMLNKLATLLNQALTTNLLAPNQQIYVRQNMLPQISRQALFKEKKAISKQKAGQRKGMPAKKQRSMVMQRRTTNQ